MCDIDWLSTVINLFEINSFIVHTQYTILDRNKVQWNKKTHWKANDSMERKGKI